MVSFKTIETLRAEIKELSKDYFPDDIIEDIDHFDVPLEGWGEELTNFWNESVSTCLNKLKDKFNFSDEDLNKLMNDAANNFQYSTVLENVPPVRPNLNADNKSYSEIRTDEIEEVLNNNENLNFTQGEVPISIPLIKNLSLARLIMPISKRGVEVEDLNRNFWVIGQNLDFLNKFWAIEFNGLMNDFIVELMGIWNNIYKLWEALIELDSLLTNHVSYEKVRVVIDWTKSLNSNIDYEQMIGIEGATGADENDGTPIKYFNINKYIDNVFKKNGEYLSQLSLLEKMQPNSESFIRLDLEYTSRPLKDILDMIKSYNFYIVGKEKIYDVLSLRVTDSSRFEYDEEDNSDIKYLDLPNLYREPISNSNYKLWIDFINESEENGSSDNKLCTISEIDFVSYTPHASWGLDYDINISIPSGDIIDENNDYKYEDVVRINKPFANLNKISYKDIPSHIASLNNKDNLFTYTITEEQGGVFVGKTISLDGFFPYVPIINKLESSYFETINPDYFICNNGAEHYTWATVNGKFVLSYLSDIVQNPYNGVTCYTPLLRERQFASSDMISYEHDVEGQTKKDNKYIKLNSPAYNLRYINGRGKNQQMEIITTKDQSRIIKRYQSKISPLVIDFARIVNFSDTVNSDKNNTYLAIYTGFVPDEGTDEYRDYIKTIPASEGLAYDYCIKPGNVMSNFYKLSDDGISYNDYVYKAEDKEVANSLDIYTIWERHEKQIKEYIRNHSLVKNIGKYESKLIFLAIRAYGQGRNYVDYSGSRFLGFVEAYREEGDIQVEFLFYADLGDSYFNKCSLHELNKIIDGKDYSVREAYTRPGVAGNGGGWEIEIAANSFPIHKSAWTITGRSVTTNVRTLVVEGEDSKLEQGWNVVYVLTAKATSEDQKLRTTNVQSCIYVDEDNNPITSHSYAIGSNVTLHLKNEAEYSHNTMCGEMTNQIYGACNINGVRYLEILGNAQREDGSWRTHWCNPQETRGTGYAEW